MKRLILGSTLILTVVLGSPVASDPVQAQTSYKPVPLSQRGAAQLTAAPISDSTILASTIKSATVMAVGDNTSGGNRDSRGITLRR
jgi:hypothetical protein